MARLCGKRVIGAIFHGGASLFRLPRGTPHMFVSCLILVLRRFKMLACLVSVLCFLWCHCVCLFSRNNDALFFLFVSFFFCSFLLWLFFFFLFCWFLFLSEAHGKNWEPRGLREDFTEGDKDLRTLWEPMAEESDRGDLPW